MSAIIYLTRNNDGIGKGIHTYGDAAYFTITTTMTLGYGDVMITGKNSVLHCILLFYCSLVFGVGLSLFGLFQKHVDRYIKKPANSINDIGSSEEEETTTCEESFLTDSECENFIENNSDSKESNNKSIIKIKTSDKLEKSPTEGNTKNKNNNDKIMNNNDEEEEVAPSSIEKCTVPSTKERKKSRASSKNIRKKKKSKKQKKAIGVWKKLGNLVKSSHAMSSNFDTRSTSVPVNAKKYQQPKPKSYSENNKGTPI